MKRHTLFRFFLVIGNVGKKKTAQACACAASLQLTDLIATCCGNQLIFYYDIWAAFATRKRWITGNPPCLGFS